MVLSLGLCASVPAQGGPMGGSFGGGFIAGPSNRSKQQTFESQCRQIEESLSGFFDKPETKFVLTPGEYCEWKLDLKKGQVVIAQATSEMFDPAVEIVDSKDKVAGLNDDRYPGDQRPLMLFRCPQAGSYSLRVRCFKNRSGGQFASSYRVIDTIDAVPGKTVECEVDASTPYLIRIPMKAGQICEIMNVGPITSQTALLSLGRFVSPIGLPVAISDYQSFTPLGDEIIAPVDGDYYRMVDRVHASGTARVSATLIPVRDLTPSGETRTGKSKSGQTTIWRVPVKAGQLLALSTPELSYYNQMTVWEEPNFKSFDLNEPERNPFFPNTNEADQAIKTLDGRDKDGRIKVIHAFKDTVLWVHCFGSRPKNADFAFNVRPAAAKFDEGIKHVSKLSVGSHDYWEFSASPGEVMSLDFLSRNFVSQVHILDPDLRPVSYLASDPDFNPLHATITIAKPGAYIVHVGSQGNGGGGEYNLSRKVYPPKPFAIGSPAKGEVANGEVQVWKFSVKAGQPIIVREYFDDTAIDFSFVGPGGDKISIPMMNINSNNRYTIFNPSEEKTYLAVVTGKGPKTNYRIEVMDLPGISESKK